MVNVTGTAPAVHTAPWASLATSMLFGYGRLWLRSVDSSAKAAMRRRHYISVTNRNVKVPPADG